MVALSLDELALLRGWLHGVPMESLEESCFGDSVGSVLLAVKTKLVLKARRLDLGWNDDWLERKAGQDSLNLVLRRLETLQNAEDIIPQIDQPLSYWLPDNWLEKMAPLRVTNVEDWVQAYHASAGKRWWLDIVGLGDVTANAIENTLVSHFPRLLIYSTPALEVAYQTAIVPLEQFLLPKALDGADGSNRSPNSPFIPATDDYQAILCWLSRLEPDSHTRRSYQREAERLLLWTILLKHKALSSLDMTDMGEYRQFLGDPQPSELWIGKPQKKAHTGWKPFTGPLSASSRRLGETILNGLFNFLVTQHYLLHNPLHALSKLKKQNGASAMGVHRAFSIQEWQLITWFIEGVIPTKVGSEKQKWRRIHLILQLGYGTGLRLHELANATLGDIEARQRQGLTQYWLETLGKGEKLRQVPLPLYLYNLIAETHFELGGKPLNRLQSNHPLIPALRGSQKTPLTPLAIHKAVKEAFDIAAQALARAHPETAAKLAHASTHWLRHTHGSIAVDRNIPLPMIRDNLGHSNISTTSQYVHAEDDARHEAFIEGFSGLHKSIQ